ncbi:D-arabinono-1,4-lactone oxidase [Kocuria sp. TGY1127_2]|uniref:D-arabinono-1,4-lactone oxidase n=1 Tax=Kocuria sp. TGY1127_2 TaxID=2711328 RepID=UPI0015B9A710
MHTVSNWSGIESAQPQHLWKPRTQGQAVGVVRQAADNGERIRVVGAAHSFTPIALGDEHLVNLDEMTGLVRVDLPRRRARFLAGTRLRDIPRLLEPYGLALTNQGDVNPQSIAGAISTGTHGTGLGFTGFGGTVTGLSLVTPDGSVMSLSASENPEIFDLARISVGVLGMILEVELECVEAFDLVAQETGEHLEDLLASLEDRARSHDHLEFFWFPHTDKAVAKTNTRVPRDAASPPDLAHIGPRTRWLQMLSEEIVDNGALSLMCEVGTAFPRAVPAMAHAAAWATSNRSYRAPAHEVFVSPRRVRFNEAEYAVPLEEGPEAIREVKRFIERNDLKVSFPVEGRVAAADDVPLSTAFGRETMYIAVHQYFKEDPTRYLGGVEKIMRAHGGRPHWGKRHSLGCEELSRLYPRFEDFRRLRERLDPDAVFGNAHTDKLFGVTR